MKHKATAQSRIFLIRVTFPLILIAVIWSTPTVNWIILGLLALNLLDFAGGIIQLLWQPKLLDYRFAVFRDVMYTLVFYLVAVDNPHISALILFPSALTEIFVVFGSRVFIRALIFEFVLLVVRMTTMYVTYHRLHPSWAILICTASVIMGLLGLEIRRLEQLETNLTQRQEELKKTLAELVSTTLANSGIDEELLTEEDITPLLEQICEEADMSKAREIGERMARVITAKQEASKLLTTRELEVLALAAEDHSYSQIAKLLLLSEGTVRAHAASIMRKIGVHTRRDMVKWASQHQLLSRGGDSAQCPHPLEK